MFLSTTSLSRLWYVKGGKLCPVAVVGEGMDVHWSNEGMPAVREALDAFIAELE